MTRLIAITSVLAALAVAGCGGDDGDSGADQPAAESSQKDANASAGRPSDSATSARGSVLSVQKTSYGTILADADGRTLYLFTKESSDTSRCYGACAQAWPPFLTKGEPRAGQGATADLLGTTDRSDGSTQVTYHGRPLYYYVDDTQPGEVGCQNVSEFGGLWLVVAPSGQAIRS
jgi:predicted lipoprotein with Yx(FWY)xxD motif